MQHLRFVTPVPTDFFPALRRNVDEYFNNKQVARTGDWVMFTKTIAMFAIYLVPYAFIMLNMVTFPSVLLLSIVMGIGGAGLGLAVMHDANHGSYSTSPILNRLLGYTQDFLGGSSFNWKLQHNVLHHTYTNVYGMDDDLAAGRIFLRFSPHQPLRYQHRFQHIYAPILYALQTLVWTVYGDYTRLARYVQIGLVAQVKANPVMRFVKLTIWKIFYFSYIIVLPTVLTDLTLGQVLLMFVVMHAVMGLILSFIFQMAHVMDDAEQPLPNANGVIENDWAIHQLTTTADFAPNNSLLNWYAGGLNFQVVHHLFPNVCHIHYFDMSKIIEKTAKDFNLPYTAYPSFASAIKVHLAFLKSLGRPSVA